MPAYRTGVYVNEVPTSLMPMRHVEARMPVVFGCAPVQTLAGDKEKIINKPVLCHTFADFVQQLGWSDDPAFTLAQAAHIFFRLYSVAPVVFVNVYDPAKHKDGPQAVMDTDIVGGIDPATGIKSGLELADTVFPTFRQVPGRILVPGFSQAPALAQMMIARAHEINTMFRAQAIVDLPVDYYTQAAAWKNDNNYVSEDLICCLGTPLNGKDEQFLSLHHAALDMQVDSENGDIPFVSASNHNLRITGFKIGKDLVNLGPEQAASLEGEGIVTAINFDGGWKLKGNRTACYPSNTDPKDSFIPIRCFFNWLGRTLILSYWSRLDQPIRKRFIHNAIDSANVFLNGLQSREIILGGRCAFLEAENPVTDLMDGIIRFHIYVTPPTPAREIDFTLEYDPGYFSTLFNN